MCVAGLGNVLLLFLVVIFNAPSGHGADVSVWLTKADASVLFQQQNANLNFQTGSNNNPTITVDETQTFQTMDGYGNALTGGSAIVINSLPADAQDRLLKELFTTDGTNIGVSYLRVSIGASDMSDQHYTYDDMPSGQTDPSMSQFSIRREQRDLIPVLKKIIALYPTIKILGSPWTAPPWMKDNNSYKGGSLKPENYPAYAIYFVKYIQAMKTAGITIDAITTQNEPEYGGNDPSMVMHANQQAEFIKNHLGPAFRSAGITTKIIIWDHNCDRPDYPITILNDAQAKPFVDGSGFHLYGGDISAMTQVQYCLFK
jgi:glucosylceramidase